MRKLLDAWHRWRAWNQRQWDDSPAMTMLVVAVIGMCVIVAVAMIAYLAGIRL